MLIYASPWPWGFAWDRPTIRRGLGQGAYFQGENLLYLVRENGNALLGGPQLTGGSSSVRDGWDKLRVAGAQVREMLIGAAAGKWNVDRGQLRAENGMVLGPNGMKATYGELAEAASKLPVPEKVNR